jgi:sec-independent protein translocase protein TatC
MRIRNGRRRVRGSGDQATVVEHLSELRFRIVRSLLAVAIGMLVVLLQYERLLEFLTEPYRTICREKPNLKCNGTLYGLGPIDGFSARMRISVYGGLILALPVIVWQVWRFVAPALHRNEKRYAVSFIVSTVSLFSLGAYLAYWTLGRSLEFLISWSGTDVEQAYQITKYVNLVFFMVLAFGVGFLFPVVIVFLQLTNILTPSQLAKQWRWAVMIIFVTAAVMTPDGSPVSLFALSIPMCLLYVAAVLIGYFVAWRRRKRSLADRR